MMCLNVIILVHTVNLPIMPLFNRCYVLKKGDSPTEPLSFTHYPEEQNNAHDSVVKSMYTSFYKSIQINPYTQTLIDDKAQYMYSYVIHEHWIIIVVSPNTPPTQSRIINAFLNDINLRIKKNDSNVSANVFSLNTKNELRESFKHNCNLENDKISKLNEAIEESKNIMAQNVTKAMERGDDISSMHEKSITLTQQALNFQHKSNDLKKQMCLKHAKFVAMISGAIIGIIIVIVLIVCKPSFKDC